MYTPVFNHPCKEKNGNTVPRSPTVCVLSRHNGLKLIS